MNTNLKRFLALMIAALVVIGVSYCLKEAYAHLRVAKPDAASIGGFETLAFICVIVGIGVKEAARIALNLFKGRWTYQGFGPKDVAMIFVSLGVSLILYCSYCSWESYYDQMSQKGSNSVPKVTSKMTDAEPR